MRKLSTRQECSDQDAAEECDGGDEKCRPPTADEISLVGCYCIPLVIVRRDDPEHEAECRSKDDAYEYTEKGFHDQVSAVIR